MPPTGQNINAIAGEAGGNTAKGASAGLAIGSLFGPWGAGIGAGIGAAFGAVSDIKARAKMVKQLVGMVSPAAAKGMWSDLSFGTLLKHMGKDWSVCAWNDNTGTCGGRTAAYLCDLVGKHKPDPWGITDAACRTLLYKAFGNKGREKQWAGTLAAKLKKSGIPDLAALGGAQGATPQTVAAWLAAFKSGAQKPMEDNSGGTLLLKPAAAALAGKGKWPAPGRNKVEASLRVRGTWPITVAIAKGQGYVPTVEENVNAAAAMEKYASSITITTKEGKKFFARVAKLAEAKGITDKEAIAEIVEESRPASQAEAVAESELQTVTLAALGAIVAAVVLGA
jgi:hypothetical protein